MTMSANRRCVFSQPNVAPTSVGMTDFKRACFGWADWDLANHGRTVLVCGADPLPLAAEKPVNPVWGTGGGGDAVTGVLGAL